MNNNYCEDIFYLSLKTLLQISLISVRKIVKATSITHTSCFFKETSYQKTL